MRTELTIAVTLPAFRLGAEPLVALAVVGTGIAQLLGDRVTFTRILLHDQHVVGPTDADAVREGRIIGMTESVRLAFAVRKANI